MSSANQDTPKVADTIEFYSRPEVVKTFEEDRYTTSRGKIRYTLQNEMALGLLSGTADPMLEIAGGTGRFSRQFAKMGRNLTVLDSSPAMIEQNQKSLQSMGYTIPFYQGVAQALPFDSGSFSTVFCVDMFSHISDPKPIISEMSRVLKPGGHLVINFTNKSSLMGIGAAYVSNPLRRALGKLEVFSSYHPARAFLSELDRVGLKRERTTGLFFIDPRLYRFEFGDALAKKILKMERFMSAKDCPLLYEQIWVKAVKG